MGELGVVLHGGEELVDALAAATGHRVVPGERAAELGDAAAVIGLGLEPWPAFERAHEDARAAVGDAPYYAVQAWHLHPAYLGGLADAVATQLGPDRASGDHVLFTAPGPGEAPEPRQVVFLREVAEAVTGEVGLTRRSIAWVGGGTTPTSLTALTALAEAHDRTRVLRCSLDPLGRPDGVPGEAASLGIDLREARLDAGRVVDLLAAVVATVRDHEGLGEGRA